ncbi:MAG: RIP metalloprotease RseP [Gammaproteobacteria bacterium]
MTEILTSILAFILALGLLVAVHEYGHFWVARKLGVKVLRFCLGFGKPIWSKVAGPDRVEYAVAAIPLGGYVKLLDEREGPVDESEKHRAFNNQSSGVRIAILAAGPVFNFIFAIVAYWLMFLSGVTTLKPIIGTVDAGSLAAEAGVLGGDEIVSVAGKNTTSMMAAQLGILDTLVANGQIQMTLRGSDGQNRDVLIEIDGEKKSFTEPGELFPQLGLTPWRPVIPPLIGDVTVGGSADESGLRSGDLIVRAEGEEVSDWSTWVDFVRSRPDSVVDLEIRRDGALLPLPLQIGTATTEDGVIGRIGAGVRVPDDLYQGVLTEERLGPLDSLGMAMTRSWEMSALTVRLIYRMLRGDVSARNISGPINIAQVAGYTARAGLASFLNFLAIVSLSLGILNLLPVPMLDGGQIAYQLAEIIKGSPVSERAQMLGQQVGIVLLLILMSFAFYNDIANLTG